MPVPVLKYKPSADCSYTQLISKIKGVPLPLEQSEQLQNTEVDQTQFVDSNLQSVYDFRYKLFA